MSCRLTLFIPELLSGIPYLKEIPATDVADLISLQRILSRSRCFNTGWKDLLDGIYEYVGFTKNHSADIPVAAISLFYGDHKQNRLATDKYYILADPVLLQADRDCVVLIQQLTSSLTAIENQQFCEEINHHFMDEPWRLIISDSGGWYLELDEKMSMTTTPIYKVLAENTQMYMPNGEDAKYWLKILNEIQMLLFSSDVNTKRQQQEKMFVNSLWLWGGGKLPQMINSEIDQIWANDSHLRALSKLINANYQSIAKIPIRTLIQQNKFSNALLITDSLTQIWKAKDLYAWMTEMENMNNMLFAPVVDLLTKGIIDELYIYPGNGSHYEINQQQCKRWWKRDKPLSSLVMQ